METACPAGAADDTLWPAIPTDEARAAGAENAERRAAAISNEDAEVAPTAAVEALAEHDLARRAGSAGASSGFTPPYPPRPRQDLALLKLLTAGRGNFLAIWPEKAFEWQLFGGKLLRRHVFICNSPDTVQYAFVDKARNFERKSPQQRNALVPLIGDGLFISDGPLWKERRRVVAPITHVSRLPQLTPVMTEVAQEQVQHWHALPDGAEVDALAGMAELTAEVICRTIFGRRLGSDAAHTVVEAFSAYQAVVGQMDILSLLGVSDFLPRLQGGKVKAQARRIHAVLDQLIGDILTGRDDGEASLIRSMAESISPTTGRPMDRQAVRNEAATLFMAGHETTANTLAWAWYLLSQDPLAEARLHAEVDRLGGRAAVWEDLPQLPFTRAVVEETLRLFPPVPLQARETTEDDRIRSRAIPAGSLVILVPWLLHRHKLLWEKPDQFVPERFLPGGIGVPSRYAYVPFSIGPRVCTGAAFGLIEAVLVLATLAQQFRLRLKPGHEVMPVCRLSLRPGDALPMLLEKRRRA